MNQGKLVFYFGTMGSSKSANALMTRFQYVDKNIGVLFIKPDVDTRDDFVDEFGIKRTVIKSRIGISADAVVVKHNDTIGSIFYSRAANSNTQVIICDEAQFLTEPQVKELRVLADEGLTVLCYGLRTDFKAVLFEGSKALMELADSVKNIESVCSCGNKAIINARIDSDGNVVKDGEQIKLGGNESYIPLCFSCWYFGRNND